MGNIKRPQPKMGEEDDQVMEAAPRRRVGFSVEDDSGPEAPLMAASPKPVPFSAQVVQGVDLSNKPKVILLVGRGKTGKTTAARWMTDRALEQGRELLLGDLDPTNATFKLWFDAERPSNIDDAAGSVRWLERFIQHSLETGMSELVDMGGGDATLRRLVDNMPGLVDVVEGAGAALVMLYFVGPHEDDLSPLMTLEERGFQPAATGIVLNEGAAEIGADPERAFARVRRHTAFRQAVERGAVPIWMPRLQNASLVELKRLQFSDAETQLPPFDRMRVAKWRSAMEESWAGVPSWLP